MDRFLWIFLCWPMLSVVDSGAAVYPQSAEQREGRPCVDCHEGISRSFAVTRMADGASSTDFLAEWGKKGRPDWCASCHAPSGGRGLVCADCHGTGPHPYPKLQAPGICARCHDAPGESTVRRFLEGPAARRGEDCLNCHLPDTAPGADHAFQGPTVPGFLDGVATVRVFLRAEEFGGTTAVLRLGHRAGHALPGGTTGRSVWLLVRGLDADGEEAWTETVRFGWEHHPDRGWLDRTLPPGRPAVIEVPELRRGGAVGLRAELWYRFQPGPFFQPDPRAVRLDQVQIDL